MSPLRAEVGSSTVLDYASPERQRPVEVPFAKVAGFRRPFEVESPDRPATVGTAEILVVLLIAIVGAARWIFG